MRQLTVHVAGDMQEDRTLAVPFDVYGPNGEPVGHGTASPLRPNTVTLTDAADHMPRVHVVALLPNGERLQESAPLQDGANTLTLSVGTSSPHEWLQWVTPFRSLEHLQQFGRGARSLETAPRRIGAVWMTLWALRDGRWVATDVSPTNQMRDQGIRQVTLDIPELPHMLQIGGDDVAWRLVSLPPAGQVRVALTRRATEDGDSIDVTVGRTNPVNELVMAYLSSGAAVEAGRLADAWQAADLALYEKERDSVSAAAGAYVLLKMNRLDERRRWVDNLVNWFPNLADGPIVAAALALQRSDSDPLLVRKYLAQATERGLPVFSLGISILVETMAAVHRGKKESKRFQLGYQAARTYLQARVAKGAYFSFFGRSPAEPSWTKFYGAADTPVVSPPQPPHGVEWAAIPLPRVGTLAPPRILRNVVTHDAAIPLPRVGTLAPALERALVKTSDSKSTDDLLRLGLSRQYNLPTTTGLQQYDELWTGSRNLGGISLERVGSDLNAQRQRNAFTVFDGDE